MDARIASPTLLAVFLCITLPAIASATSPIAKDVPLQIITPALISIIGGVVSALLTTSFRLNMQAKIQQEADARKQEQKNRIQYLNPLRISAEDLRGRLSQIINDMKDSNRKQELTDDFRHIDEKNISDQRGFLKWCNIDGYFSMSTLYITSLYLSRANSLRSEFPIAQLNPAEDERLLAQLSKVREAFGGRHGIWESIQDSLGSYIEKPDNSLMDYREFCLEIADSNKHVWFRSLIDFYVKFHMKLDYEVPHIMDALNDLISFLTSTQRIQRNQGR